MSVTLANCYIDQLEEVKSRLHLSVSRRELIFAAGALNNKTLLRDLGSQEKANFYDGMVAAGHIDHNPYWPEASGGKRSGK